MNHHGLPAGAPAEAGTSPRRPMRWRLSAVVYAVVVILGLAGTGAHAQWSQSGTAAASVSTGQWGPTGNLAWTGCSARKDGRLGTDHLVISFTAPADADHLRADLTGDITARATKDLQVGTPRASSVELTVKSQWLSRQDYEVTLTPAYAGIPGQPVKRTVTLRMGFFGNVEASCG